MGVISAGLGIGQAVTGAQAAQQQVAFANAQAQQGFRFQQMQAGAARNFEQLKASQQEGLMQINRLMADNAYANDIAALNARSDARDGGCQPRGTERRHCRGQGPR
jgi:hypothetical protein